MKYKIGFINCFFSFAIVSTWWTLTLAKYFRRQPLDVTLVSK